MSEELENSLQQAIESYLGERLRAIHDQLSRLQAEFNEAFARLRESSAAESLDATPVSAAIAAHLQTAREQKLSGGASGAESGASEVAAIKRAVAEIEKQQSQANVLSALLSNAAQFAERVALFVIKNDQAIGWRVCESSDANNLEAIPSIVLPLSADTVVGRAARSRFVEMGMEGSESDDKRLIQKLGGAPQRFAAVPLIVRGRVVAALYADSRSPEPGSVNADALETLVRVAGMAVDLVSTAAQPVPAREDATAAEPAVAEPETAVSEHVQPVEAEAAERGYVPHVEPQTTEMFAEPEVEVVAEEAVEPEAQEVYAERESEVVYQEMAEPELERVHDEWQAEAVAEEAAEPEVEEVQAAPQAEAPAEKMPEPEPVSAATGTTPQTAPPSVATAPAPGSVSQYAAPLGSARRYGLVEPELPVEVGEDERRLHNDARRFARLLVSEIKLYNEPKVKEGRSKNDIYERLRDDIDRSRQMYDKRVAPPVAARHDYFHQELVNTLAEGDPSKLGSSYPGALVSMN